MPKDQTAPTADDITAQLEVLRKDMTALTQSVSDLARDRATRAGEAARDSAREHTQAIADSATQMTRQAEDAVRAQPLAATAIAAGLGFALGFLSTRR